jgi:hypothetical protein
MKLASSFLNQTSKVKFNTMYNIGLDGCDF